MSSEPFSREYLDLQTVVAGRYTIESELGRGGMGIVFLARDVGLDRPVAIKLLPSYLAARKEFRERFLQEARLVARLSHPNIVTVHAVEDHGELVFFVMAYVRGDTLTRRVERSGPLPPAQATRLLQELAWGLGYAHANGVIHRDVKPDNVLIEQSSGRAMLTDFGVALGVDANRLTGAGQLVGTPEYMSPELASGEQVDGRSDLYSLGATAFYALTGQPVFQAPSPIAMVTKHLHEPAPPLAGVRRDLPIELTRTVDRCLAKEPEKRFPNGEELAEALAATGLTERDLPAPIRHYFRQGRGIAVGWLMLIALMIWFGRWVEVPPDRVSRAMAVLLLLVAILWPAAFLLRTARKVLQHGLTFADVRASAGVEARVLAEESRAVYGGSYAGDLRRTREDWLRFLAGPFGRLIFWLAGAGRSVPPASPRPDSMAAERIVEARAVEAFNNLSSEMREQIPELPEVGDDLCCRVEELRGEAGQQDELARVIGTLERLRLDLLRLQAGEVSVEEVSAAVRAAAAMGQETASRRVS